MPTSPSNALDLFFSVMNPTMPDGSASANYGNINFLMQNVFSQDATASTIPAVGITDYGPQFLGADDVKHLFDKLLHKTFKNTFFISPMSTYLIANNQSMAAAQTLLGGTQTDVWYQHNDKTPPHNKDHYSPPISTIQPDGTHSTEVPAVAVFTFGANFFVNQLSMYFDRYKMNQDLNTGQTVSSFRAFAYGITVLEEEKRRGE
jgi:hypothetical protein